MVANLARVPYTLHQGNRLPGFLHAAARGQHLLDIGLHRPAAHLRRPLGARHERRVLGSPGRRRHGLHRLEHPVHGRGAGEMVCHRRPFCVASLPLLLLLPSSHHLLRDWEPRPYFYNPTRPLTETKQVQAGSQDARMAHRVLEPDRRHRLHALPGRGIRRPELGRARVRLGAVDLYRVMGFLGKPYATTAELDPPFSCLDFPSYTDGFSFPRVQIGSVAQWYESLDKYPVSVEESPSWLPSGEKVV